MDAEQKGALAKIQLGLRISNLLEDTSIYIKDSYTDTEIADIADHLLRHGMPCPRKLPASPSQRLQVMQMMARAWVSYEVLDAICDIMGEQPTAPTSALPGELVKCTYEGLPLDFEEWDDLYVVGDIPAGIWDKIRDKHEEHMKNRPGDWQVDELGEITVQTLKEAGLRVYTFRKSCEFPAMRNVLCDFCRCIIPDGDKIVRTETTRDAGFCSVSCLYEALTSRSRAVRVVDLNPKDPGNALLECPHCHQQSWGRSDCWLSEGSFTIPGENGLSFSILTCPRCGDYSVYVEPQIESITVKFAGSFTAEKPVIITETGLMGEYPPPPKKGGHFDPEATGQFEYYCPLCLDAWKDNDPNLPKDLFCPEHTSRIPLSKRFSQSGTPAPEGEKHG